MANTGQPALIGSGVGPVLGHAKTNLHIIPATIAAGATYATGGNPVTPPKGVAGTELIALVLLNPHDGTRMWVWNGSTSAPKIMAYDAFATEEGNTTDVSAVVNLRVLFIYG